MSAYFGLDIGSYSIKALQIEKDKDRFLLTAGGQIFTPANLFSDNTAKRKVAEALITLVRSTGITAKNVVVALPESAVFSQVIELPFLSPQELSTAIEFEAEQYVPIPLNEVQLEYLTVDLPEKSLVESKMKVLLIAARKQAIETLLEVVQLAGLSPIAMETEILAVCRLVLSLFKKNLIVIDLGYRSTDLAILVNGSMRYVRSLNTGGEAFTRSLARSLSMDFNQAEQYKFTYGLDPGQLEGKVAKGISIALNIVTAEIKKSIAFFVQQNPQEKIEMAVVTGGGAAMPAVSTTISNALSLETLVVDPFVLFNPNDKLNQLKQRSGFSVSVGLAMREK